MKSLKAFCARKKVILSLHRYGIDALGAMAQGLFCTLLVGTILNTLGGQLHIGLLTTPIAGDYTIGGLASAMVGPGIAVAIGHALHCPPLVLYSLIPVGFASNAIAGAGGPLAVYLVTIIAAELGNPKVANMVMLGAYIGATGALKVETIQEMIHEMFTGKKAKLVPLNLEALQRGIQCAKEQLA